ncbi:phage portal protein [Ruminococcus flavefaciens]|uniref:HK97 family phage portal protein n=1 Tax=Ruminococcus flavefaciens TaxID=1265 RepID=A0A315Y4J8_RUMFL|nr:phage portal protein [Ruminococcus flavefaciens]PWJ13949.1 HK97 family phage portal protein [Ruminococcus flavefaciens]SSA43509.1 phage portal protein, HK97 family [Ruminococcus flavefaciens]
MVKIGLFKRKKRQEIRADTVQSAETSILTFFGITGELTREAALSIPTVSACIGKIGETISQLPVKLYCKDEEQVTEIFDDPRIKLLNGSTGDTLSTVDMWKAAVEDYYLGRGAWIFVNSSGLSVKSLHYVDSRDVSILSNTDPIFKAFRVQINAQSYYDFQFIKLLRRTRDGYTNIPLQEEASSVLSAAWNALKLENMMNSNGGCKPGFLKAKNRLSDAAISAIKEGYQKVYDNEQKRDKIIVLNDGVDFEAISSTAAELQMNENKKTNSIEICKLFGFPHTVIDGGATENDNKKFTAAVIALLNQIETELDNVLLLESEKEQGYYWAFDTKELTRGSLKERYDAYEVAVRNNILQIDEIRREEDYEPLGFNFVKLGLSDVLLNPETMEVFTPNTGQQKNLLTGEERAEDVELRYNHNHDEKGRFASGGGGSSGGAGGKAAKKVDKSEKDAIIEHKEEIIADFKSTNFNGEIHIPPREIDVNSLSFDKRHIMDENHDVNLKSARQYINNAKVSYTKHINGEEFENYIGDKGATYVNITKNSIRTAFPNAEFTQGTKRFLDTVNKHLK